MNKTKGIILGFVIFTLLAAIPLTIYLVKQQQDTRSRADEPSCQTPQAPANVHVSFPNCEGDNCSFENASCSFDNVANAATYTVKITEVDTGTEIKSEILTPSTTKIVFPVTNGNTYKCDVAAVNSCGQAGSTASDSKLCVVEGALPTPTPVPPTSTPIPTNTPVPGVPPTSTPIPTPTAVVIDIPTPTAQVIIITPTPMPTLPPPGDNKTMAVLGAGSVALTLVGAILFLIIGL